MSYDPVECIPIAIPRRSFETESISTAIPAYTESIPEFDPNKIKSSRSTPISSKQDLNPSELFGPRRHPSMHHRVIARWWPVGSHGTLQPPDTPAGPTVVRGGSERRGVAGAAGEAWRGAGRPESRRPRARPASTSTGRRRVVAGRRRDAATPHARSGGVRADHVDCDVSRVAAPAPGGGPSRQSASAAVSVGGA